MRSSTRISGVTFIMFVIPLFYVNGRFAANNTALSLALNTTAISSAFNTTTKASIANTTVVPSTDVTDECKVVISKRSKEVFQHILKRHDPRFVQFHIKFSKPVASPENVFQPSRWYWTHGKMSRDQFLSWNFHYGIYSFGLLDFKTVLDPFVLLYLDGDCNLTLGMENTSKLITNALIPVVDFPSYGQMPRQYTENYFCYLAVSEDLRHTIHYFAAMYILYPIIFVNYKCCFLMYNFTEENFRNDCSQDSSHMIRWTKVIKFNIILGLAAIAYFPIFLFQLFAWLGKNDKIDTDEYGVELMQDISEPDEDVNNEDWIFANGKSPLTFFDVVSFSGIGVDKRSPVLVSRLRRFICLLFAPSLIYIKMFMFSRGIGVWKEGDKITIKDFVDIGTPLGFLSFFGDPSNRRDVFVPALGGPIGISIIYFILGFVYIVLPKCLKQNVENGLPNSDTLTAEGRMHNRILIKSPLFFGTKDIIKLSQINVNNVDLVPGYSKGVTLMKNNFFMLFKIQFWRQVWQIQTCRVSCFKENMTFSMCLLSVFCFPLYLVICLFECLLCILYFGVPLTFFMVVMVRGGIKMISSLRQNNILFFYLYSVRFTRVLGAFAVFVTILLFTYCILLLTIDSLTFISHVMTYCFIAVIVYPSVSFGSLFLLLVIIYYIFRQLKHFRYNYTRLLNTAVQISERISVTRNHVTCSNGHLLISNVESQNLRQIEINGQQLNASQNVLWDRSSETCLKIKMKNNCYGIPKDLFYSLIQKFRPVHVLVLSLLLRVLILVGCVLLFLYATQKYLECPEGQISEVMHVIFIVAVGALPKLLETNFLGQNNAPIIKIENKYIEQSIVEYWTQRKRSTMHETN